MDAVIQRIQVPAHPRSRGEHETAPLGLRNGSSPLTRGARRAPPPSYQRMRLIPAHAGSTRLVVSPARCTTAHPRSRGEHRITSGEPDSHEGSSPLTRGALHPIRLSDPGERLIPAHAGSTFSSAPGGGLKRAHPRSRGEHAIRGLEASSAAGSSPLTRGAPRPVGVGGRVAGLIPAHAGSTRPLLRRQAHQPAHPRSRGEHAVGPFFRFGFAGSSPLTRGAPRQTGGMEKPLRLIPAHAGSTRMGTRSKSTAWAHPRSRGEHARVWALTCSTAGSSPLTRGALERLAALQQEMGLIPAHAGSIGDCPPSTHVQRAHPRSRGEHRWRR